MSPRKPTAQFPVNPSAIKREIRAAARKLRTKKKAASAKQGKAIEKELRILRRFYEELGNIVEI